MAILGNQPVRVSGTRRYLPVRQSMFDFSENSGNIGNKVATVVAAVVQPATTGEATAQCGHCRMMNTGAC